MFRWKVIIISSNSYFGLSQIKLFRQPVPKVNKGEGKNKVVAVVGASYSSVTVQVYFLSTNNFSVNNYWADCQFVAAVSDCAS